MILGIEREAAIFADALLTGFFIWGVYTSLRIFRRIVKHKMAVVAAEDLTYWFWTALFLFREMYLTCDGSIRWYFVLGVCLGGAAGYGMLTWIGKICRILKVCFSGKRGKPLEHSRKRR